MSIVINGKESYKGSVVSTFEQNGYHDSDFYAVVWDSEKKELDMVEFNSTRYAGGGYADVDYTREVKAEIKVWLTAYLSEQFDRLNVEQAKKVTKGKKVKVVKGRKIKKGSEGYLFFIGDPMYFQPYNKFEEPKYKVGFTTLLEPVEGDYPDAQWSYISNFEVVNWEYYLLDLNEKQEWIKEQIRRSSISSIVRGFARYEL